MDAPGECLQVDSLLTGWCFTTAGACWSFSLHDRVTGGPLVREEYHESIRSSTVMCKLQQPWG